MTLIFYSNFEGISERLANYTSLLIENNAQKPST